MTNIRTLLSGIAGVAILGIVLQFWRLAAVSNNHVHNSIDTQSELQGARKKILRLQNQIAMLIQQQEHKTLRFPEANQVLWKRNSSAAVANVIRMREPSIENVDVNFTLFGSKFDPVWQATKTKLFLAVISSQSERAAKQRRKVRSTWFQYIHESIPRAQIQAKFFVGISSKDVNVTAEVLAEIDTFGDIAVVNVGDQYGGLVVKIQATFQWVIAHVRADFVGKFDDDCYVSVGALLTQLSTLPKERLYFGKMMGGGPIQHDKGRNSEPNMPVGVNWFPPYASGGGGYVLSWDLVQTVAFPPVKLLDMVNEDGHLGIVLLPFDIHRVTTSHIYPYGVHRSDTGCIDSTKMISIHYVKDKAEDDCMADIHYNVSHAFPICESRFCGPVNCNFSLPRPKQKEKRQRRGEGCPAKLSGMWVTNVAKGILR